MDVPRLRAESELQLPVYATATATRNLSCICDLHHSSWQHQILNPLSEARDRTGIGFVTAESQQRNSCYNFFFFKLSFVYELAWLS